MLLSLLIGTAWPCAGLVHEDGALAESDAQEAIFTPGEGSVTVSYNVHYDGNAEDFGWIIPIFGEFVSMADGDEARFDALREATQPTVDYVEEESSGGGGCGLGCGASDLSKGGGRGDTAFASNGIDVVAEGFTGTYAYTVVSSGDPGELTTWAADNGWELHDSATSVEDYAAEGGVQFVLIRLEAGAGAGATPEEGRQLPPVDLTYSGDALRFPAKMARYGSVSPVRTSVYVVGDARANITSGWTATELGTIRHEPDYEPSEIYDMALTEIGGSQPGYGVVWAGELDGSWVTRFDTLAEKAAHTVDPVFSLDGGDTPTETVLQLGYFEDGEAAAWLFLPAFGLGLSALRRRRG